MALSGKDVLPEKKTGFTYKGKEIILSKTRGREMGDNGIRKKHGWYPDSKRIEVVTLYAALGNATRIQELSGIPHSTIRKWAKEQWFKDLLEEIRGENNEALDAKFTEIVHKSQDLIMDRLENGDFHMLRDGTICRKPVGIRDLALTSAITVDKRQIIRNKPTSITGSEKGQADTLEKLKDFFIDLAQKGKKKEVITDVEFTEVGESSDLPPEQADPQEQEQNAEGSGECPAAQVI